MLKTERSQTLEGNVEYSFWKLALHGDVWYVDYANPIVDGFNLTMRSMSGFDLGAHFVLPPLKVWAYYSRYLTANESSFPTGGVQPIGDLAFDKLWGEGDHVRQGARPSPTLFGRWIGPRDTVATNPIPPRPVVLHARREHRRDLAPSASRADVGEALRMTNILDSIYYQPGMETAGSGNSPGVYTGTQYVGSKDIFNSLLPQPRHRCT